MLVAAIGTVATLPAVAQHRDAVGDAKHLVEPVRDIDDADAARAQPAQRAQQSLDVGFRQRRGRLVEDQNVRSDRERAGDGDERPLGGGQRRDPARPDRYRRRGDRSAAAAASRTFAPGDEAEARARIARLERDVFGDASSIRRDRDPDG